VQEGHAREYEPENRRGCYSAKVKWGRMAPPRPKPREQASSGSRPRPRGAPAPAPVSFSTRSTLSCARWPGRPAPETANYSVVVLVTLIVVGALIFGLDYVFANLAKTLFK